MRSNNYSNAFRGAPYRSYRKDKFEATSSRADPVYPRPEVKFIDKSTGTAAAPLSITNIGATNMIVCLNRLSQGVTGSLRIGQQVAIKSVYYQLVLNLPTVNPVTCVTRIIIFWDRTPKAVGPGINDILSNTSSYVTAPMNLQNRDRFVVLADERVALSPFGEQIKFIEGYRKINQLSTYEDSTETEGPIPLTGGLFVLYVSDVAADYPTLYGIHRTRYMDN